MARARAGAAPRGALRPLRPAAGRDGRGGGAGRGGAADGPAPRCETAGHEGAGRRPVRRPPARRHQPRRGPGDGAPGHPPLRQAPGHLVPQPDPRLAAIRLAAIRLAPIMKLLLVEDDRETAAYVKRALTEAGHAVDHASDGRDGLLLAAGETYDVMVLDRMLPRIDGLAILRTIRASGVKTPVLLLTALGGIDDRVEGLEAGGDDYLVKPFAFAELLARVNALARRPP